MVYLIVWGIFAIVAGVIASNKNRSVIGWVALSLLLTPLTILILLALPRITYERPTPAPKVCPQCAEEVKYEAKVCRFCGHTFTSWSEVAAQRAGVHDDDEQARMDRAAAKMRRWQRP
jgi:hypothetical protein